MAKKLFIGVDLGGTSMRAAAVADDGSFAALEKRKTHPELGVHGVFDRLVRTVQGAAKTAGVSMKQIGGIGVGVPGPVDTKRGVVRMAVNLSTDWANMPLAAELKKALGVPAYIDNDVRVGATGEFVHGAGRDVKDMVAVFVGTGIGGGIVLDGKLRGGFRGGAGEVGHTVVAADNGIVGKTGQPGTVEPLASRTGMESYVREQVSAGRKSVVPGLMDTLGGGRLTSSVIFEALSHKDAVMHEAITISQRILGLLAGNIVNTLDVEMIVFGGGVTERLDESFVGPIRVTAYANFINKETASTVKIVPAALKDASGVVGAAVLARRML
ncbi:MAG TPA: ROK family protein [Chthonomonadaceae bacterium]|nr:ROK family protein [Chthonomonadaceae bacterium]